MTACAFSGGGWRTEVGVETFAAPCGFDEENGFLAEFLHRDAEGEFGADRVFARGETRGEFAFLNGVGFRRGLARDS